jgi:menaquinone-dependent protoporphyrinogen IX oxidase
MMKLLPVYGSTEGQTQKIAQFLAHQPTQLGHRVTLIQAGDARVTPPRPRMRRTSPG